MLINCNRPQLYSSQINYNSETPEFFEIKDPKFIDKRRTESGLEPIEEFPKSRQLEWNIKQKP